MAPKVTSSSNRNKRGSTKPVTKGQNPQRANRQATSRATVSQSGGGRGSGARVTNASQRTTSGSARVTGGARPALPPGRSGGALATRPPTQSTRQANARAQLRDANRGSTGPNRVGQPAGSANRTFGANRVNQAVNRAVRQNTVRQAMRAGTGASIVGALLNAPEELKKLQALLRNPKGALSRASSDILSGKAYNPETVKPSTPAKPKPNMNRPGIRYEKLADTQAPRSAYGLKDKPTTKPPAKAPSASTSTPSRSSSTSAPSRAPSRSSTPARSSAAASRPAASRPAATPAKATPKSSLRSDTVQGTGPIRDGGAYARNVKKQPTSGNSFAGSKDMSASEMAASYNTKTNYGSRVNTAFSAESPSATASTPKKKSSALSQAEIRKRRLNR